MLELTNKKEQNSPSCVTWTELCIVMFDRFFFFFLHHRVQSQILPPILIIFFFNCMRISTQKGSQKFRVLLRPLTICWTEYTHSFSTPTLQAANIRYESVDAGNYSQCALSFGRGRARPSMRLVTIKWQILGRGTSESFWAKNCSFTTRRYTYRRQGIHTCVRCNILVAMITSCVSFWKKYNLNTHVKDAIVMNITEPRRLAQIGNISYIT